MTIPCERNDDIVEIKSDIKYIKKMLFTHKTILNGAKWLGTIALTGVVGWIGVLLNYYLTLKI